MIKEQEQAKKIYDKLNKLPVFTPFGWAVIFLLLFIITVTFAFIGHQINSQLIQLQSQTNNMEHTTNYKQLHKVESEVTDFERD